MKRLIYTIALMLLLSCCVTLAGCTERVIQQPAAQLSPEQEQFLAAYLQQSRISAFAQLEQELLIYDLLASLNIEEKIGQLLIARFPETASMAMRQIADFHPAGYIFFARDFQHRDSHSFRQLTNDCLAAAQTPLFFAVDEEGGTVVRISRYSQYRDSAFPSPQQLGGLNNIIADTQEKAQLLGRLGLNINFAPVCDISTDSDDYIYPRTLGKGAAETSQYVSAVVQTMREENIGSVLKHFPGYGNNIDTHDNFSIDNRSRESFFAHDLLPFSAGIAAQASMVLVSHNIVTCFDAALPASLSPALHQLLRQELGFEGVIITDDLSMGAISLYSGEYSPSVLAIIAGNDMLCTSDLAASHQELLAAFEQGIISEEQINRSLERILRLKISLGLMGCG